VPDWDDLSMPDQKFSLRICVRILPLEKGEGKAVFGFGD
jgi:hypothetical protein